MEQSDNNYVLQSIIFTTAAQLVDSVDKTLIVVLRDGRKIIGILRSFDQYANLVLQNTVERIIVGQKYSDIERGVYIIRGENVVLVGEIDPEKEGLPGLEEVPLNEIYKLQQDEVDNRKIKEQKKNTELANIGFSIDGQQEDMY
ncbi:hypothetical protein V1514DRAFT_327396 [Lipomyces japonicus]|uniref:uncharacterized protein n=1 Tax=Lipomyces japonicus TaxID=56871 RepID=UPI0034CEB2F6